MRSLLSLLIVFSTFSFGCQRPQRFDRTQTEIVDYAKRLPGEIYISRGGAGPYNEGPSAVGNDNEEGSFYATTKQGRQPEVSWPATPGFYYEASSYINQAGEAFYLVRKIPVQDKK